MLNIEPTHAILGKIANNIENHGEEEVTAFDIPVTNILLDREQLNALLDDSVADRVIFNKTRAGDVQPALKCLEPFALKDNFDGATIQFNFGTGKGEKFTLKDCKVKAVTLEPQNGGNTVVTMKIRVRPENDNHILQLMGHQNRECTLSIAEAKVATTAAAKKQMDMLDGGDGKGDEDEHEAAGEAQAEALRRSTPIDGRRGPGTH